MIDAVKLTQELIQINSTTPAGENIIDKLIEILSPIGFKCSKITFGVTSNLYAVLGNDLPNLCFAGHSDVVETYDGWKFPPFAGIIDNEVLYGRGAQDMKAAIACFISAVSKFIKKQSPDFSISLLISGNEEGDPTDGMVKMLDWLVDNNIKVSDCLVGEPTNLKRLGDNVKIGRKGSINFTLEVNGIQGHVAFPDVALNPGTILVKILSELKSFSFDEGTQYFSPTNLEITNIHIGNDTCNIIPGKATARFNIRFNNLHSTESLNEIVDKFCQKYSNDYILTYESSADACLPDRGVLEELLAIVIKDKTGIIPNFTTLGGTSDARFIKKLCPVIEFGMMSDKAHKIDESVTIKEIHQLTEIYLGILENYKANKLAL